MSLFPSVCRWHIDRANEVRSLNPDRVKKEIRERLIEVVGWRDGRFAIHYRVEFGNIPAAILRVASEIDSDLIVLGVRRRSGVLDRFVWPIAYELVRSATCPVLTIRGSGRLAD